MIIKTDPPEIHFQTPTPNRIQFMDHLTSKSDEKPIPNKPPTEWQFEIGARTPLQRCTTDLLQNCDLPPPAKVFSPHPQSMPSGEDTIASLLRALQFSQTRAREAEKAALLTSTRNQRLIALFMEDSMMLSAHRHWLKLLEAEISMLKEKSARPLQDASENEEDGGDEDAMSATAFCLALALCMGIAGVGFMLGRYLF